jgi:hypothetical protein
LAELTRRGAFKAFQSFKPFNPDGR